MDGMKMVTCDEVVEWLHREAELLDDGHERAWLESLVSREVVYQVPLRQTRRRADGSGFVEGGFLLDECYGSLSTRITRNESPWAWTEDPPPRTRRFVTNIRVRDVDGGLAVRSNLLVYRTRGDQTEPHLLSGERHDVLRREDGSLRLHRRVVLLDLSVLGVPNMSYLL
jgi:3-phenylpropionate/cinnamic acid dioxygenase small subunit